MAAKINWHRYGTKLRHCRPMYANTLTYLLSYLLTVLWTHISLTVNGMLIGSTVFARLPVETNRHMVSAAIDRISVMHAMRPKIHRRSREISISFPPTSHEQMRIGTDWQFYYAHLRPSNTKVILYSITYLCFISYTYVIELSVFPYWWGIAQCNRLTPLLRCIQVETRTVIVATELFNKVPD